MIPCADCNSPMTCRDVNFCHKQQAEVVRRDTGKAEELQGYRVEYMKLAEPSTQYHVATFDNLEDAQLWWDSIYYLRAVYMINAPRPK